MKNVFSFFNFNPWKFFLVVQIGVVTVKEAEDMPGSKEKANYDN